MTTIHAATVRADATVATFDRAELAAALGFISRAIVDRRNTVPVLSGMLIVPGDNGVAVVSGTDLDMEARVSIAADWSAGDAIVVADARAAADAVAGMDGERVAMTAEAGRALFECGGATASLATLPAADMPRLVSFGDGMVVSFDAATLAADWARIRPAISTEETRYYLNGISLTVMRQGGGDDAPTILRMAATDGHRLAVVRRPVDQAAAALPPVILPRKFVAVVAKRLGKRPSGTVQMTVSAKRVRVTLPDGVLIDSKLIDGSFPDVERVIPQHNGLRLTFDAHALAETTRAVAKAANERLVAVRLEAAPDGAVLSVASAEGASSRRPIACGWDVVDGRADRSFTVGINASYLRSMAGAFGKTKLVMAVDDASSPILFTSDASPEFQGVVMPMRI